MKLSLVATSVLAAAALTLSACGSDSIGAAGETTDVGEAELGAGVVEELSIEGVWSRESPSMASNGAAYMVITSPIDDRLIGASVDVPIAGRAEIHEVVMAEGTMTMQQVEAIELAAGETVALEPGGYHIMLLELVEPLVMGESFDLTLDFANAGPVTVSVEVRTEAP